MSGSWVSKDQPQGHGGKWLTIDRQGNTLPPYRWTLLPAEMVDEVEEAARKHQENSQSPKAREKRLEKERTGPVVGEIAEALEKPLRRFIGLVEGEEMAFREMSLYKAYKSYDSEGEAKTVYAFSVWVAVDE